MSIKENFNPFRHNIFKPNNPEKYRGKLPCIARSSWEMQLMRWLDVNPSVLEWSSESLAIQYFNPIKQRISRYYPDFTVKIKNKDNEIDILIVEVKPFKETVPPSNKGKKTEKTRLNEEKTWIINKCKWEAAISYCNRHGYKFKILTEKQLFKG